VFDLEPRAHWMVEYYRGTVLSSHDDVLRVRIVGADWAWLVRFGLRHAGMARVVEPAELRKEVGDAARAALSAYDGAVGTAKE
jgi:proteasome accessory factor C